MPQYKREQWVLANRIKGCPTEENFKIVEEDVPELRKGEILCRSLYISIDPITRYNNHEFWWSYLAPIGGQKSYMRTNIQAQATSPSCPVIISSISFYLMIKIKLPTRANLLIKTKWASLPRSSRYQIQLCSLNFDVDEYLTVEI